MTQHSKTSLVHELRAPAVWLALLAVVGSGCGGLDTVTDSPEHAATQDGSLGDGDTGAWRDVRALDPAADVPGDAPYRVAVTDTWADMWTRGAADHRAAMLDTLTTPDVVYWGMRPAARGRDAMLTLIAVDVGLEIIDMAPVQGAGSVVSTQWSMPGVELRGEDLFELTPDGVVERIITFTAPYTDGAPSDVEAALVAAWNAQDVDGASSRLGASVSPDVRLTIGTDDVRGDAQLAQYLGGDAFLGQLTLVVDGVHRHPVVAAASRAAVHWVDGRGERVMRGRLYLRLDADGRIVRIAGFPLPSQVP